MLFQADVRGDALDLVVATEATRALSEPDRATSWLYAREIVDGVVDHRAEIDGMIALHAQGWSIERMPHVDRAILRLASWEILHNSDVPVEVAIDEAIELAKEYSTEDSSRFVNGVLGQVAKQAAPREESQAKPAHKPE
jgi:N utilization substance protein B